MAALDMAHENPRTRRRQHESTCALYLASAGASFMAILLDLIQNTQTALGNKIGQRVSVIWPYSTLSDRDLAAAGAVALAIFFLVAVSVFLCWIRKPPSREEAFVRGLGVLSVLTLIAPYSQPRDASQSLATGSRPLSSEVRELAYAQPGLPGATALALGSAQVIFRTPDLNPDFQALVTVRDSTTGAVVGTRVSGRRFTLTREASAYDLLIEADGYRRTRTSIAIFDNSTVTYTVDVDQSNVPIGLQLVYPPESVDAIPGGTGLQSQ